MSRRPSTTRDAVLRVADRLCEAIGTAEYLTIRYFVVKQIHACDPAGAAALTCAIMTGLEHREDGLALRAMLLTALLDATSEVRS